MDSKTLLDVIREYNSHEKEIFDNATDIFISKVRDEFEKMYRNHEWTKMIGVSELGIFITELSDDFQNVEFRISPYLSGRNGKEYEEENYNDPPFTEYIERKRYIGTELCKFQDEDILAIKPYCESLERKGFGCYVYEGSRELVVTIKII